MTKRKNSLIKKKNTDLGTVGAKRTPLKEIPNYVLVPLTLLLVYLSAHGITIYNEGYRKESILSRTLLHALIHPAAIHLEDKGFLLIVVALIVFFLPKYYMTNRKKYFHEVAGIEKDSAEWNTDYEGYNKRMNSPYGEPTHDGPDNIILSQNVYVGMDGRRSVPNMNTIIFGGSGSGKSRSVLKPNILNVNASYVISDPSGEMATSMTPALKHFGYEASFFNVKDMSLSDHYNPLRYIHSDTDVTTMVKIIMENTQGEDAKPDQFFDSATEALLQACVFYLVKNFPEEASLPNVMKLIDLADVNEENMNLPSTFDILMQRDYERDHSSLAYKQYRIFHKGTAKTIKSILVSAMVRLTPFNLPSVRELTSSDTIHLETFGTRRRALFIILPTADQTFSFLPCMMYKQLFTTMYTKAENEIVEQVHIFQTKSINGEGSQSPERIRFLTSHQSKEEAIQYRDKILNATIKSINGDYYLVANGEPEILKEFYDTPDRNKELLKQWQEMYQNVEYVTYTDPTLPEPTLFLMDEIKNIAKVPDLLQIMSTCRKYNIGIWPVYQDHSQAVTMYGDGESEEMINNCSCFVYLGGIGKQTATYVKDKLGDMTVRVMSETYNMGDKKGGSRSFTQSARSLATVAEISQMPKDQCIIFVAGEKPFNDKKFDYTSHTNYKYTADGDAKPFILKDYFSKAYEHSNRSGSGYNLEYEISLSSKAIDSMKSNTTEYTEKIAAEKGIAGDPNHFETFQTTSTPKETKTRRNSVVGHKQREKLKFNRPKS